MLVDAGIEIPSVITWFAIFQVQLDSCNVLKEIKEIFFFVNMIYKNKIYIYILSYSK